MVLFWTLRAFGLIKEPNGGANNNAQWLGMRCGYLTSRFCIIDMRITACAAPSVARIASEDTGVADLDLPLLEGAAKMQLYPGLYPLDIRTARVNCTITIKVSGGVIPGSHLPIDSPACL